MVRSLLTAAVTLASAVALTQASVAPRHDAVPSPLVVDSFGPSIEVAASRGPQIFNAIFDALRKWGCTVHPNGMSFFLATVPEGVLFHHGNGQNATPTGLDWLAYEIEHAEMFARPKRSGPPGGKPPGEHSSMDDPAQRPLQGRADAPPSDSASDGVGFLHIYRTTRPLQFLYLDGMSGDKDNSGVVDTQDYVLRAVRPNADSTSSAEATASSDLPPGPPGEHQRALDLCDLSAEWGLQGVIRIEGAGVEIIKCNFFDGLEEVQVVQRSPAGTGPPHHKRPSQEADEPSEPGQPGQPGNRGPPGGEEPPRDGPPNGGRHGGGRPGGRRPGGDFPGGAPGGGPDGGPGGAPGGPGGAPGGAPDGGPNGGPGGRPGDGGGGAWGPRRPTVGPETPELGFRDVGSERTLIDFSSMVSAFFFPVNLSNPTEKDEVRFPRLVDNPSNELLAIRNHLVRVLDERRNAQSIPFNFRDVADLIVRRYAPYLTSLVLHASSVDSFASTLRSLLNVFVDYSVDDAEERAAAAIQRCTRFYIQTLPLRTETDRLLYAAFEATNAKICKSLFAVGKDIMDDVDGSKTKNLNLAKSQAAVRQLIVELDWSVFDRNLTSTN